MSDPLNDINMVIKNYISTPFTQINLGYAITSFWTLACFYLGIFLISLSFLIIGLNASYRQGDASKKALAILAMFGVFFVIFGILLTVYSFSSTVDKIENDIKKNRDCSIFVKETPKNVLKRFAAEQEQGHKISMLLEEQAEKYRNLNKIEKFNEATSLDLE